MKKSTVCLNMIVKNERAVIERCLHSVLPMIDYWVIIDTGSTDGTQKIIRKSLSKIPGTLLERKWIDFAHNRNEALLLAQNYSETDYLFFIDADEKLLFSERFCIPEWKSDTYLGVIRQHSTGVEFLRTCLLKRSISCHWQGAVREDLLFDNEISEEVLDDPIVLSLGDGRRSQDRTRYFREANQLESELKREPNHPRILFLLAECYFAAGSLEKALSFYRKRLQIQDSGLEEVYLSLYTIATIERIRKQSSACWVSLYQDAFAIASHRAEPLFWINTHHLAMKNFEMGYELVQQALSLDIPRDRLPVERWIYDYGLLLQLADLCLFTNRKEEGRNVLCRLLSQPLPAHIRYLVEKNQRKLYR